MSDKIVEDLSTFINVCKQMQVQDPSARVVFQRTASSADTLLQQIMQQRQDITRRVDIGEPVGVCPTCLRPFDAK